MLYTCFIYVNTIIMGKLKGIVQFTGHFDGLSFYEMNGTIIVRKTGGFSGEKIKNDPNFIRVRENSNEFAHCSKVGKYFRNSILLYLNKMAIPYVHNRVLGLFQDISRLDLVSERGKRNVSNGLLLDASHRIVKEFEFDKNQSFSTLFPFTFATDLSQGRLTISNFCAQLIKNVKGATHLNLQFVVVGLDFEQQNYFEQNCSPLVSVSLQDHSVSDLELNCVIPQSSVVFGFLYLEFFQRINDVNYDLKTRGLKIVGFQ